MKVGLEMLECSYLPYILLEGVFVVDGTFLDMCSVVVDGVDTVMQELSYLAAVGDAQSDKGEDADRGGELFLLGLFYALFGAQQGIEGIEEMGEELQEGRIEVGIKLLQIFFLKVLRTGHFVEFVVLACLQLLVHSLAQILYLGDIDGAEAHKSPYILFFDSVGIGELVVDDRELTVRDRELLVERLELIIELVELLVGLGEVISCDGEFMSLSADVEYTYKE